MPIAVGTRNTGAQGVGATVTWSHTVGAGDDRILLVAASITGNSTATIPVPTFGAQSFVEYHMVNLTTTGNGWGGPVRVYLFRLIAPVVGTDTITLSPAYGGIGRTQGSSISFTGVHQTSPFNAAGPHTQNSANVQPSIVVTSAADQWAVGCWSAVSNPAPTAVLGAGQTAIGEHYGVADAYLQHLFTDEDSAGASVTLDYTGINVDPGWGVGGIGASLMPSVVSLVSQQGRAFDAAYGI